MVRSVSFNFYKKILQTCFLFLANNLYGLAQCLPQPLKDFRWLSEEEIEAFDVSNMTDEQEIGFILEVDLQYPAELHRQHNSFPLAPQHLKITEDILSPYAKSMSTNSIKRIRHNISYDYIFFSML